MLHLPARRNQSELVVLLFIFLVLVSLVEEQERRKETKVTSWLLREGERILRSSN
jgi:hypothetical protein